MKKPLFKFLLSAGVLPVLVLFCSTAGCSKKSSTDDEKKTETEINYSASQEIFSNPERGFIHTYIVKSDGAGLETSRLSVLKSENVSLILRLFYLDKFKVGPISESQLSLIRSDLEKIRNAGVKCILRFAYTDEMDGTDAPLSVIEQHLDQLKPIFIQNQDVISFVQAGFIGAWGEWHSSSNGLATTENQKKVLFKLLEVLPPNIMVQVRTPGQKQSIFNSTTAITRSIAYTAENQARVGHHNDCFMSGGSNYGTYINIEAEKTFISNEALFVPTGGETCPPTAGYDPSCVEGKNEMQRLKWTYLNLDYYQPTLNAWKSSGCFNEFQRNLGYRLSMLSSRLPATAVAGQDYKVSISMTNTGYAPLYNYKIANLILKDKAKGTMYSFRLETDLRDCKPAATLKMEQAVRLTGVPAGDYDLFLKITDQSENLKDRAEYSIRLANADTWNAEGSMNALKHQLKVTM